MVSSLQLHFFYNMKLMRVLCGVTFARTSTNLVHLILISIAGHSVGISEHFGDQQGSLVFSRGLPLYILDEGFHQIEDY